jgi:peptide/nickel transport system ATP-binding protein
VETIARFETLRKHFQVRTDIAGLFSAGHERLVKAVDGVSFEIYRGEILGLIGESGSGKTTIGRLLMGLETPDSGRILVGDRDIVTLKGQERKDYYHHVQMIFQDPFESLNPRFTVYETVNELVKVQRLDRQHPSRDLVPRALSRSGLRPPEQYLRKYPHQLSGGERQRLSIARALVVEPKILLADEPVSMLDVSIKAGILNLLRRLVREDQMTLLYISHDLSTVKYLCDRIVILYLGRVMEIGGSSEVIDQPLHPYAQDLRSAIPNPDPDVKRERLISDTLKEKSLLDISGCRYHPECRLSQDICRQQEPGLRLTATGRRVACHFVT